MKSERLKPVGQGLKVLFSEQFGRRHQRHLCAGRHRRECSERGDDRFSRTDIALDETKGRRGLSRS